MEIKPLVKNAVLTAVSMGCMYALLWLYSLAAYLDSGI